MSSKSPLGNCKRGLVFIISAPAGTGKTTLVQMLVKEFDCVVRCITSTTRPRRPNEIADRDYHFLSKEEFEERIKNQEFLEYVTLYGYYYGTRYQSVEKELQRGRHVIMVIDTQGALLLKQKRFPGVFVFIRPPSIEVLRERLTERRTESNKVIEERLEWAKKELLAADKYDYCIVNDELLTAYQVLRSVLIAEEHRVRNEGRDNHGVF